MRLYDSKMYYNYKFGEGEVNFLFEDLYGVTPSYCPVTYTAVNSDTDFFTVSDSGVSFGLEQWDDSYSSFFVKFEANNFKSIELTVYVLNPCATDQQLTLSEQPTTFDYTMGDETLLLNWSDFFVNSHRQCSVTYEATYGTQTSHPFVDESSSERTSVSIADI